MRLRADWITAATAAAAAAFLVACGRWTRPGNPPADPPPRAGRYVEIAMDTWNAELGTEVRAPAVIWYEGECLDWGAEGCYATGLDVDAGEVYALARERPTQTDVEIALLHWTLAKGTGDPDWDREHPIWRSDVWPETVLVRKGF